RYGHQNPRHAVLSPSAICAGACPADALQTRMRRGQPRIAAVLHLHLADRVLPTRSAPAAAPLPRQSAPRPKLLFLVTEDWYFWSDRLPFARALRDAGYDIVVATRVRA